MEGGSPSALCRQQIKRFFWPQGVAAPEQQISLAALLQEQKVGGGGPRPQPEGDFQENLGPVPRGWAGEGGYRFGASVRREERQLKRPLKVSELREGMNEAFLASLPAPLIPPP